MAAHIYTVLQQVIEKPESNLPYLKHGLSYAQFGDNMEANHWVDLNNALDRNEELALEYCKKLLPIYQQKWRDLGCPTTAKEWFRNKYANVMLMEAYG